MKRIPLSGGRAFALVDDRDFKSLSKFTWTLNENRKGANKYCSRVTSRKNPPRKRIYMHHEIMGNVTVDHRDGNGLNNRRGNLRSASDSQNQWNRGKPSSNTTGYVGVSYCKRPGRVKRFYARIGVLGVIKSLGCYLTAKEAGEAYIAAAKKYHGEFKRW